MTDLKKLSSNIKKIFPGYQVNLQFDEITLSVPAQDVSKVLKKLKTMSQLKFEQLIDLAAVDFSEFPQKNYENCRYAAVYHLLSLKHNSRIRVKAFIKDNSFL